MKEVLATYDHIELTEEEEAEAILLRKWQKEKDIEEVEREKRASENRKALVGSKWDVDQTRGFMLYRAGQIFQEKPFTLDSNNQFVFDLLCHYFSEDRNFISLAESAGVRNPSLEKGICLVGGFGVGKTWLMELFRRNQRQVFFMRNAKQIADEFEVDGEGAMPKYTNPFQNAINDSSTMYQPVSGLCIDDLGTEDVKVHYGNKKSVIGDIIEKRYANGNSGPLLHCTTNLKADQIEGYYGGRIRSRMREVFNFIELKGTDRRK